MNPPIETRVALVHRPGLEYFRVPPFAAPNPVYQAVEAVFRGLGLDRGREGTPEYNPLREIIAPGDRVIVKPNFVSSRDRHARIEGSRLEASSTHASLLKPILDFALKATGSRGSVTIVDAPLEGCELSSVLEPLGVKKLLEDLTPCHANLSFIDLRHFRMVPLMLLDDVRYRGRSFNLGLLARRTLDGDPRGYRVVDLGQRSFFSDRVSAGALCFHRSHRYTPLSYHHANVHKYSIPQTVLDADVIISVPKMKTHKKAGVTLSLKGAIGLSNQKYWLPHFTRGSPAEGGDEFDRPRCLVERFEDKISRLPLPGGWSLVARAPRVGQPARVIDGSWEGNDTLWRTILDLNLAILYADSDGNMQSVPQRKYLTIVDGIVAGEGEGPLGATPVNAGVLVGGFDPVLVDEQVTRIMGFDPTTVRHIARALEAGLLPSTRAERTPLACDGALPHLQMKPPRSWPSLTRGR